MNEVICHGIPDKRELVEGDIVNIDVTTCARARARAAAAFPASPYNRASLSLSLSLSGRPMATARSYVRHEDGVGYHGDLNETFLVGKCSDEATGLVKTAFGCLSTAISMVKPGTMFRDIGPAITKTASAAGLSVVRSYCGHGIGGLFHTSPNVPHYNKNKAKGVMKPGMIFTIEPMINVGSWRDTTWPDNWTAVTADGSLSAQFEHTVLVTGTVTTSSTQRGRAAHGAGRGTSAVRRGRWGARLRMPQAGGRDRPRGS